MRRPQAQALQAGTSAIGSIGAAAASDARIKEQMTPLGFDVIPGVPATEFTYTGDPTGQRWQGVIAQDLEKQAPEHVTHAADGTKLVSSAFAPTPVGGPGQAPAAAAHAQPPAGVPAGDMDELSPEQRQAILSLSTGQEKQGELERQYARAEALKKGRGIQYTTPIGAAFGGLTDSIDRISGAFKERDLDRKEAELISQMGAGRGAYAERALSQQQRQNDRDEKRTKFQDEYTRALIAKLVRGGSNE
jgi:hypothetical protein